MTRPKDLFNDIDRLLRVIYRELCFDYFQSHHFIPDDPYWIELFDLSNTQFRSRIIGKYIQIYPGNYHTDDLENLITSLEGLLSQRYSHSNSLYLIFLTAHHLFKVDRDNLYVEFNDLIEWDGFRNKLDPKLFVSAYNVGCSKISHPTSITSIVGHDNKQLYDILRRHSISENHMHLKASGYTDEINWYSFLQLSFNDTTRFADFISRDEVFKEIEKTKQNQENLIQFIIKVRLLRIILMLYVLDDDGASVDNNELKSTITQSFSLLLRSHDVLNTLDSLGILKDTIALEMAQTSYWKGQFKGLDLTKYAAFETNFYQQVMTYIYEKNAHSDFITIVFNLYIAGITQLKFQFLQDNLGMGFTKFKEKEELKSIFIKDKSDEKKAVISSVFHKYYREKYINNIEIRVTPEQTPNDYIEFIQDINNINHKEYHKAKRELKKLGHSINKINYGVIIHFIKPLKSGIHSMVEDQAIKRKKLEKDATVLLNTLDVIKKYSDKPNNKGYLSDQVAHKIVGIDTANYEKDNRPELFGTIYRKMRDGSPEGYVLKATYHVGEEFPTLSNGLRAIDEVLTFLDYRANDRLGHALALGSHVENYYHTKRQNIFCSIGDYLDDLVWMYSILVESDQSNALLLFLRDEFEANKLELFNPIMPQNEIPDFETYLHAYFLRGDSPELHYELMDQSAESYEGFCQRYTYRLNSRFINHRRAFLDKGARDLFLRYSFDKDYRENAERPFHTETSERFICCVKRVQRLLQEKILRMTVYIEANPSSNKKISYVQKYSELPAMNLSGPLFGEKDSLELPISINTDDSTIFSTNLVNEYSMLAASLIREGYQPDDVYHYIEKLAIASNIHSFVQRY
ncbi:hypothetical protein [uncultured Vagococcus sp.]|uniref:hypothetical protein n=1 Tax=uncultured Vagococcus sp. TaxID=189676 RepID=UPI0028D3569D|nr:hypothetical protein [uncultured Vagococcus sp.]